MISRYTIILNPEGSDPEQNDWDVMQVTDTLKNRKAYQACTEATYEEVLGHLITVLKEMDK